MGIKGLNKLISQYAPNAVSYQHINELCGSRVAIDSEILIHKFRTQESPNSHIFGFVNNVFWYLKHGIVPVYVFDGMPNIAKQNNVIVKRTSFKEQMASRAEELENKFVDQLDQIDDNISSNHINHHHVLSPEINDTLDELFKIQRKLTFLTVTKNHRNECKYLLKLMGIPFIVAPEDAEALCVALHRNNIVDYVYTEDTDVYTYFAASLTSTNRSIKIIRAQSENDILTLVDFNVVLKEMKLNPKAFVDMCILCGCDFTGTIPRIGPVKAYHLINQYDSIENCKELFIPDDFKYLEARNIFYGNHLPEIDKSLKIEPINLQVLKEYLIKERNLNPEPIIFKYNQIYKIFKQKLQINIQPSSSERGRSGSESDSTNKNSGS